MDIATLIKEFGLPIVIIIVLGWFIGSELWPWVKQQFEALNADRKQEREEFLAALHELTSMAETQHDAAAQQAHAITQQLEQLTAAIQAAIKQTK